MLTKILDRGIAGLARWWFGVDKMEEMPTEVPPSGPYRYQVVLSDPDETFVTEDNDGLDVVVENLDWHIKQKDVFFWIGDFAFEARRVRMIQHLTEKVEEEEGTNGKTVEDSQTIEVPEDHE